MKHYKTITEVKQNLPEIIDTINSCKIKFDIATMFLKQMQEWCVDECVHPEKDYGWWTTLGAYAETLRNQMDYLAEIEYLQGLLDKLPKYKDKVI